MTVGEWKAGSLAGGGWNSVWLWRGFGSPKCSLSCLPWSLEENVPEIEYGFLLDLGAALIALRTNLPARIWLEG